MCGDPQGPKGQSCERSQLSQHFQQLPTIGADTSEGKNIVEPLKEVIAEARCQTYFHPTPICSRTLRLQGLDVLALQPQYHSALRIQLTGSTAWQSFHEPLSTCIRGCGAFVELVSFCQPCRQLAEDTWLRVSCKGMSIRIWHTAPSVW